MMKRNQVVSIGSVPQGATVHIAPGNQELRTPGQVALARRYSHTLGFEKDGYESQTAVIENPTRDLWRNLIWIHPAGWVIGAIVDLSTGAGYSLEPTEVSVTLTPIVTVPLVEPLPPSS